MVFPMPSVPAELVPHQPRPLITAVAMTAAIKPSIDTRHPGTHR